MGGAIATRYAYDAMNRLTNMVQTTNGAVSASAGYAYDTAGRLWKKIYPVRYEKAILLRLRITKCERWQFLHWLFRRSATTVGRAPSGSSIFYAPAASNRVGLLRSMSQPIRCNSTREVSQDGLGQALFKRPTKELSHGVNGNNDVATHSYDVESRLLSLGITNGTTLVQAYSYLWGDGGNILAITNYPGGASALTSRYSYDAAGQLTNEVTDTVTNSWVYDEAGNWLNAGVGSKWVYDCDNELIAKANASDTGWNVTVTGEVEPGPNSNKWYNTWAECRGVRSRVNPNDGTFKAFSI